MADRITTEEAERIAQPIAEAFGAVELANIALEAQAAEIERLREALRAIAHTKDAGPWIIAYRNAGGGYEGLQEIARAALGEEDR